MQNTFTYDIETVPRNDLPPAVMKEVEEKAQSYFDYRRVEPTEEEFENHKKMIMGTSPYYGMIVCIGIRLDQNGQYDKTCLTADNYSMKEEKEMLEKFWKLAAKDRWLFVGFNSKAFDAFWIIRRSMMHKIKPTNRDFLDMYRYDTLHHFDCMLFMSDYDNYRKCSLKTACEFLDIPSPKEGEVKGDEVADVYAKGGLKAIADYCIRDIDATHLLYTRLQRYVYRKTFK
tara:strand:- start:4604 stop:5290 length:687 start_codon:yes stop_codon:yes gene_type:complete